MFCSEIWDFCYFPSRGYVQIQLSYVDDACLGQGSVYVLGLHLYLKDSTKKCAAYIALILYQFWMG